MADLAFSIAGNVLEKLDSLAYDEIGLAWGMKNELKKLETTTSTLKAKLLDAEEKKDKNEELRNWLTQLKDVFRDAEDVLDEFECEVLRSQVVKEYGSLGRKVRHFFSRSNPLAFRFSIAHQVKEIRQNLDDIAKEMAKFQLISSLLDPTQSHLMQGTRDMTHSFVNPSEVTGREQEKAEILDMILHQDHNSHNNISIISIVGIGGIGKTTLAKSIYNDKKVVEYFDLKIWLCVSLDFNVTKLVREFIVSATNTKHDMSHLSLTQLRRSLKVTLKDKKFLLVLDDVWNDDPLKWQELKELLTVGSKESKIIVTTRDQSVASMMGTTKMYQLEGLSEEDSLSLFFKFAFRGDQKGQEKYPSLKKIGKEIVKKCVGIPLELKALGSLLHLKTEVEWRFIRDHKIWELEQEHGHILPALRLSYKAMSPSLKQCLAYCSTFPKDSQMLSFELIRIWIALGIVKSPNKEVELEDIGKLHFIELCARSFFQVSGDHDDKDNYGMNYAFRVHDLIHNLASLVTQDESAIVNSDEAKISDSVRYLRIVLNEENLTILQKLRKVRSIHVDCTRYQKEEIVQLFLSTCISRFKHLRVFDLTNLSFEVLPSSIGTLKLLRYLDLSGNGKMKKLPDSICKLLSLQTLLLGGCSELEELPRDIGNLVSLRTFFVTTKQMVFPDGGIGRLKSLRLLAIGGCKNLRALPHDLIYCTTLRTLIVVDCEQLDLASDQINEEVELTLQTFVINSLPETTDLPLWLQQVDKSLENLHIESCHKLAKLPEWLPNLSSLKKLVIKDCPKLLCLPDGMQTSSWPGLAKNISYSQG